MCSQKFSQDQPQLPPILHFYSPLGKTVKGFLSIPHSGEDIPAEFRPYLSGQEMAYKEDVDFQVHQLIDIEKLRRNGIFILVSQVHRVAVDLNRTPEKAVLHWEFNTKGQKILEKFPGPETSQKMLGQYYAPYYELIKSTLQELEKISGPNHPVPAIDLHSMPSAPTEYHLKINPHQDKERPDFCVSDLRGKSCTPEYINFITTHLKNQGYNVFINNPYFGGYLTEYMHKFRTNVVQIEIKRGLYMDEEKKVLIDKAEKLKRNLTETLMKTFDAFHFQSANQK